MWCCSSDGIFAPVHIVGESVRIGVRFTEVQVLPTPFFYTLKSCISDVEFMSVKHLRKYIHKSNNRWIIQKHINGKLKSFKSFTKLDEAIEYRNRLMANNWQEPPKTPEEIEEEKIKEYYHHIHLNSKKRSYVIISTSNEYLGVVKTIEEALYYRDLYHDCPVPVPKPKDVDLLTDNPYILEGLRCPLPIRLEKDEKYTDYGKGSISRKSKASYVVRYNRTHFARCRTYEQAYYVREELNKCGWDKDEVPRILNDYPKWYTWLMEFYRYIMRNPQKEDSFILNFPREFTEDNKLDRIIYSSLEDALFERDFLVANNWDYEALVYSINDEENPYYNMDLPPYPERKIRNVSERKRYVTELNQIRDALLEGITNQEVIAGLLGTSPVNIRNWLYRYNITWKDFVNLVLSGEDIWSVLEFEEKYYEPDLSPSMPPNYTGYIHNTGSKRSPYVVSRKQVYYGSYKDKKTARRVVNELRKCNWDKKQLKDIQEKVGHKPFLNTKKWVYETNNGKSWVIRKKDKNRRMINYGCYSNKKIAEKVRDLLIQHNWDKSKLEQFKKIAENEGD